MERSTRSTKSKYWKVVWWLAAFLVFFGGLMAAIFAHHGVNEEYPSITEYDTMEEYRSYQSQQFWQYGSLCGVAGLGLAAAVALIAKKRS